MLTRNVCDRFRRSLYLILSLLLFIVLASCCPAFKNPIPPPAELKADPQILGTWVRTYKINQSEYKEQLCIFPRSTGWVDVVGIYDIDKKESADGINLLVLEGYNTSVNKRRFLCLRLRKRDFNWVGQKNHSWTDEEATGLRFTKNWIIANYEAPTNDELVIKPFSTRRVEELIKKGKLKGEVKEKELFGMTEPSLDEVTVTSSSDELVEVISREGAGAFIWDDPNDTARFMNVAVFSKLGK